jgi:hypothetical protein
MSDRTAADSEQKDEDLFVSQHSSKPHVSSRLSVTPTIMDLLQLSLLA